ncbi:hypothetical protein [Streptomyces sp. NPDC056468]|uniref:hypothetical protein n=1 Tax=Streptomyces sp. NPDC056468 TaxID=3345830 RepID=UPI0036C7E429
MTAGLTYTHFARHDVALDVTLGRRQELPIHAAHTIGLTRLLQNPADTIGARSTPGGGRCFHCDGTGRARPLWEAALSAGHDVS